MKIKSLLKDTAVELDSIRSELLSAKDAEDICFIILDLKDLADNVERQLDELTYGESIGMLLLMEEERRAS